MEWLARMRSAIDLLERRLEEPLNMEKIARAACSSTFHFQRMFHMLTGVTVAEYVRKRRLTFAAQELASSLLKVVDVALKYGYDSPESFAKAFRKIHGIAPSEARGVGVPLKAYPRISFHLSLKGDQEMEYRILEKEATNVVGKIIRTTCVEGENLRQIPQFWQSSQANGTINRLMSLAKSDKLFGICMNMELEKETFVYAIACEADASSAGGEFSAFMIPAATWALFPSVGPMPGAIQHVFNRIYQEWFPGTGYEHAAGPKLSRDL